MVVDSERTDGGATAAPSSPLAALARTAGALAARPALGDALGAVVEAAAAATRADLVLLRVADGNDRWATVRAVASSSRALTAELEGTRVPVAELPDDERDGRATVSAALRDLAAHVDARAVLQLPFAAGPRLTGTLELLRRRGAFGDVERDLGRLAAAQAALALRAGAGERRADPGLPLLLAGEALVAGLELGRAEYDVARLSAEATGARAAVVWRVDAEGVLRQAAVHGNESAAGDPALREIAADVLEAATPVAIGAANGAGRLATVQLGRPPEAILQLVWPDGGPEEGAASALAAFATRAARALGAGEDARTAARELERTRTLLAVVAQANAELSVGHMLETLADRARELLAVERAAVYLREDGRLVPAAERNLDGPHTPVAERLLELALDAARGRGLVVVEDARWDARLASVGDQVAAADIEAAVAVPLVVPEGVVGLLGLYPPRGRTPSPDEAALLRALAGQLAVALQNARLHERATALGAELEEVLALERQRTRQLRSLYEISRSFAESLSLEATLAAVTETVVELLGVDAAGIRMPDERGESLELRALHATDPALTAAVWALLQRPLPIASLPRLFRVRAPLVLDPETASGLAAYELLVPFLEKGSSAVVVPVATPGEVVGTMTLLSLERERPITQSMIELATSVAQQAALAIDNARLYQQQKRFADTMQRSLLPRSSPALPGLELGAVYESSARVDVGGDVYDFIELPDGRLAVVLGDVTGHGIDAAADMAMAKFVFRSLAREHPEPGEFLAAANEVVCGEIAGGKFITMAYLTLDGRTGAAAAAAAGHPPPRLVTRDGAVASLDVGGLALGIAQGQSYDEVRETLPVGASVVVITDGVIEERRDGELFGDERLDALLSKHAGLAPAELAMEVVAACREWGGGELADDCAVVVVRRTDA